MNVLNAKKKTNRHVSAVWLEHVPFSHTINLQTQNEGFAVSEWEHFRKSIFAFFSYLGSTLEENNLPPKEQRRQISVCAFTMYKKTLKSVP